jgi:hypothetical protein
MCCVALVSRCNVTTCYVAFISLFQCHDVLCCAYIRESVSRCVMLRLYKGVRVTVCYVALI